ncbi:lipopolysaccharide biosynthesis protein [Scytonema sp. PRP1]|uniref:lipopolysaccharide biosynthesis protein n=1 Tax=Scytonema sp. PRP1 TaxID=3120513 RepID=UPI002FD12049
MEQIKPLTLRRNFSWTFIGNAVYAACQWGMLIVMAKLGNPEMVGQFTLGLAITAPVIMFTNLHLRSVQATDAKRQYLFGDYLGLRLISIGLALFLILGVTFAAGYRWQTSLIILVIGLAKAFEAISDVFYGLIQQHERMDRIAMSMMIKGPLSLLLLGLGVYLTNSALWGAVGLAVAWAIVLVSYDIHSGALMLNRLPRTLQSEISGTGYLSMALRPRWHLETQRQLIWLSLPLGVVMMLISLNSNIPRYFIERYLGERELGFFAAIAYLMVAGGMVVNALGESVNARLAKYYAAGDSTAFRTLLFKLLLIGALLGGTGVLVALVAGRQILTLLYQPEYAEYADLFVWLMLATGINYVSSFLGYGMMAARYFRIQIPIFASVTTISAMICFWLIPTLGLLGAAIALVVGAVLQAGISLGVIVHALHKLKTSTT